MNVAALSRAEKERLLQRAFHGLYRWYLDRSQIKRDWSPDRSFEWRALRQDLPENLLRIVQGFYAVEQYVPDYTAELVRLTRQSYGRSQFQLCWGSEEAKHADLWRNTVLFSGYGTEESLENYTHDLRANAWELPFDKPEEMLLYTVFQERATQLNYMNLRRRAQELGDPVLESVCRVIAIDEAAHYDFFLEGARLYLYFFPEETLAAMVNVLRFFAMPAGKIIPDYESFVQTLFAENIFGRAEYATEVVSVAIKGLGITSLEAIKHGFGYYRRVPTPDGTPLDTAIWQEAVDTEVLQHALVRLFTRINDYHREIGLEAYLAPLDLTAP